MRVIFIFLLALVTTAHAQQINPVPDYIFRNQMSVGRNGVTDTAAYMSIGPRFGAVKGFMPPMVTDTNSVTGVKRNGLLIFSLQLNNFAYWDSTTARFRKITAEASVDSLLFATRAWRQKGDDSLGAIIAVKTDTGLISTRAYRQKGIDSVVTLISTLGGGTVLSVTAGTGMNFSTITTSGAVNADTLVLSTKAWRQKGDDSVGAIVGTKVNISDTATMLSAYLRKADTMAMLTPYLRKVDTTAMLTPYIRSANFGLSKSGQTLSSDTAAMATRARVQKGIDSVSALFTSPDTLTLSTRAWRQKGDDSLGAIIGTKATATGTTNYLSKFTGTSSLGNSIVYGTTNEIGISTSTPTEKLDVNGRVRVRTIDSTGTGINMLYSDADGVIKKAAIPAGGSGTVTSVATGYGLSGGTITTTGTLIVDTSAIATRSRVQKGIDSVASVRIGGTGTINRSAKFTASGAVGNGSIADSSSSVQMTIKPSGNIGLGTAAPQARFSIGTPSFVSSASPTFASDDQGSVQFTYFSAAPFTRSLDLVAAGTSPDGTNGGGNIRFFTNAVTLNASATEKMRITQTGDVAIGNIAPAYKLDVSGTLRNTTGAAFATSSGNVLVGTTTDQSQKLQINGNVRIATIDSTATGMNMLYADATGVIKKTGLPITGTGISGYLTKWNASKTQDTSQIFQLNGFIGIGTTSPLLKLDVNGGFRFTNDGDVNGLVLGRGKGDFIDNQAFGYLSLSANTTGDRNNAFGYLSLTANTTGYKNSAFGYNSLHQNTTGYHNTGLGYASLNFNTTGIGNVGVGYQPMHNNTTGSENIGIGTNALYYNTTGTGNIGIGEFSFALGSTGSAMTGSYNIGLGRYTLASLKTGQQNTAVGDAAMYEFDNGSYNTAVGSKSLFSNSTGSNNVALGFQSGAYETGSNSFYVGNIDQVNTSNDKAFSLLYGTFAGTASSLTGQKLRVNGSFEVATIDSTSTARNMLYQDANGVIKKSAVPSGLTMADDVMTASGSWVATKDAGSGVTINNVAYTTNGTTKMVTVDGAFYISAELFSDAAWNDVATIPTGFRPQKTVNWNSNFIVTGAEYETSGGTDFTGALSWTYAQMRVTDEGKVQINGSINTNTLDAGGGDYVVIQFTQSYIIK